MKLEYPYTVEKDAEGNFVVQFLDFEEAFTEGKTLEEAAFNAQEVLSLVLDQRMADDAEIPRPGKGGQYTASPDATVQAAALVRLARARSGKSLADLARAMDTSWASVQRMEKPRHGVTLQQLERAAGALGNRLVLAFEPNALDDEDKIVEVSIDKKGKLKSYRAAGEGSYRPRAYGVVNVRALKGEVPLVVLSEPQGARRTTSGKDPMPPGSTKMLRSHKAASPRAHHRYK